MAGTVLGWRLGGADGDSVGRMVAVETVVLLVGEREVEVVGTVGDSVDRDVDGGSEGEMEIGGPAEVERGD